MTDREAIRRLAKAVLTLSRLVPHTSVEGLAKTVLEELLMPAAPTDDACDPPNDRYEWMDECRHGTSVSCSCEFGRGYEQARRDITSDSLKTIQHPTVTREQAERFVNLLRYNEGIIGTMDCPAREPSTLGDVPMKERCWACRIGVCEVVDGESWPAFFRAAADALERKD